MRLERTPSWSIEFQREGLNHAIADPATGPDQKRATPGPQVRLALPRLTTPHHTTPHYITAYHYHYHYHYIVAYTAGPFPRVQPPFANHRGTTYHRNLARWGIAAGPASA